MFVYQTPKRRHNPDYRVSITLILLCFPQILNEIAQHKIRIYEFPDCPDDEDSRVQKTMKQRVPFAVVGANTVLEVGVGTVGSKRSARDREAQTECRGGECRCW